MNDSVDHVIVAENIHMLQQIHDKNINLALLPREENKIIKHFFETAVSERFRIIEGREIYLNDLDTFFQEELCPYQKIEGYRETIDDLIYAAKIFSWVRRKKKLNFVLESINAGTGFHVDNFTLRLITTYGPGTLWSPNDNVDWENSRYGIQVKDPAKVKQMEPFWISIIKGELYTGNSKDGLVHRGPNAEAVVRINYRIDADISGLSRMEEKATLTEPDIR